MSKTEVMRCYPDFPPSLILPYSELSKLETIPSGYPYGNLKVVEEMDSGFLHLVIGKQPTFADCPWCDTIYEVAAVCCDKRGNLKDDVGDALGHLVYYTVDSETDEIRRV